ncbi:hypothetical protein [Neorhizobium galegae]|uniref:Uncharacterized protein n=1 Tax=Neorhizobium galegae bv. orientalis str. HAMBI 540 TaxID=1028800 RepID=A0A068SKX8_NEOGA|nr:hypothetical protein [Neorhizobium galegae]MCQ1856034.1 hypothetical protein [Neorhizobium galegae]CDN46818.1 Hypothetical protein RG540_CH06280 [Neorhizobium galegae bv. orientalis str. HAMBI 540]
MGAWIPKTPDTYRPRSSVLLCEMLTKMILDHIELEGLSAAEIARKYPGFRAAYIQAMRSGVLFGEKRLLSMCEALGLFVVFSVVRSMREQTRMMEAA